MSRLTEQQCRDEQSDTMDTDSSPGQDDSQISNSEPSTSTTTTTMATDVPNRVGARSTTSYSTHSSSARGGVAAEQATAPPPVFLDRAYTMVDAGPDDVVSWSESGDSFIIKKIDVFEARLPAYFNHRNFLSFVRQLKLYGESALFW